MNSKWERIIEKNWPSLKQYACLLFSCFLLLLFGCTTLTIRRIEKSFDRPKDCQEFLNRLDEKVREGGFRDASSFPVPGFPYLRTNRFLSELKKNLKNDEAKEQWLRWMQKLDLESRRREIANLPEKIIQPIGSKEDGQVNREGLIVRVESCSSELLHHDQTRSDFNAILDPLIEVPDEYSSLKQTIGLYPLVALPVAVATNSSRKKIRSWFDKSLEDLPLDGSLRTFSPAESIFPREKRIEEMIEGSKKNPLGVPLLGKNQEKELVSSFAPIFIQDVAAPYDQIGRVVWKGDRLEIDDEKPTVYYYVSHAFLKGEPILQLNYVIWYSERAGKRAPWIEHGHLDGLTVRISLDARGTPFMVDVVNDCGCYHFFAPEKERVDRVISKPFRFDPFVPQWLPTLSQWEPLGIRINSGWHQVQRLMAVSAPPDSIRYELMPYHLLEALPHEEGRTESIFDAKGIAKGSERIERFILFSMGIPSVGSMRQRGHHAIELIGRVHFDNPNLFDQNFVFK